MQKPTYFTSNDSRRDQMETELENILAEIQLTPSFWLEKLYLFC